jgi:hypothetical protein
LTYDFVRSKAWTLLTHGGFLTYAHHDADGQMTWTACSSGAKLWVTINPKDMSKYKTKESLFRLYDKLLSDDDEIPEDFDVTTILLEMDEFV